MPALCERRNVALSNLLRKTAGYGLQFYTTARQHSRYRPASDAGSRLRALRSLIFLLPEPASNFPPEHPPNSRKGGKFLAINFHQPTATCGARCVNVPLRQHRVRYPVRSPLLLLEATSSRTFRRHPGDLAPVAPSRFARQSDVCMIEKQDPHRGPGDGPPGGSESRLCN
jgi:hypothetical protein